MTPRAYLDWNATAPLRPEARAAMLAAMDAVGNPSSVHAEGRAAFAIVERARAQVARFAGCDPEQVTFTSGATEANAMALRTMSVAFYAPTAHASLIAAARHDTMLNGPVALDRAGRLDLSPEAARRLMEKGPPCDHAAVAFEAANSETGVVEDPARVVAALAALRRAGGFRTGQVHWDGHCDATQAVGRVPFRFAGSGLRSAALSAHKLGGPKGVGAFVHDDAYGPETYALLRGGGQERGARAGTENVIGIAGFGAAAEAARRDLEAGVWEAVAARRNRLEATLAEASPETIIVGAGAPRLPNTSCLATPGWAAETQVMQLDLAGFAVSAGAACSSGKLRPSHVLNALGFGEDVARSAIRVSLGPATTDDEIDRFCAIWIALSRKRRRMAA